MSRGLGHLQRFIKEQVYRADREYKREEVALEGMHRLRPSFDPLDHGVKIFWLTWPEIRRLIENDPELNPGPYRIDPTRERSAKRALHLLVKRGEIVKLPDGNLLAKYITKEMDLKLRR